jgi:hypothetical protein
MTKSERDDRYSRLVDLGCCVCMREGLGPTPPAIHHLLTGRVPNRRNTDDQTIGLCPYHHQHGPNGEAVHAGKKSFERNHGSELELLEWSNMMIGWGGNATIGAANHAIGGNL